MCPECALLGTVSTSPERVLRRCETGERLTIRPPGVRGKAITDPAASPLPAISSVPRAETWCGLPLHLAAGTQLTLVIRTLVTCRLAAPFVAVVLFAGAEATGGAVVVGEAAPPAPAACATGAPASSASEHESAAASVAARSQSPAPDRLWTMVIAKVIPSTMAR